MLDDLHVAVEVGQTRVAPAELPAGVVHTVDAADASPTPRLSWARSSKTAQVEKCPFTHVELLNIHGMHDSRTAFDPLSCLGVFFRLKKETEP